MNWLYGQVLYQPNIKNKIKFIDIIQNIWDIVFMTRKQENTMTRKQAEERGLSIYSYSKKRWRYTDENGIEHLIHNGKEVASGKYVHSYSKNKWEYGNRDGYVYKVERKKI